MPLMFVFETETLSHFNEKCSPNVQIRISQPCIGIKVGVLPEFKYEVKAYLKEFELEFLKD